MDGRWRCKAALAAVVGLLALGAPAGAQVVDAEAPAVSATVSSPYISPNGDGRLDRVTVRVTVDQPVQLTVRLHHPGGVGSRLLADGLPVGAGTTAMAWNGRLQRPDGAWVRATDGPVQIEVEVVDLGGHLASTTSQLTVDTHAPVVHLTGTSPEPWTGRGTITQSFRVDDPAHPLTMWSQVLDGDHVVDEMVHHERPADMRQLTWAPQVDGDPLVPGAYDAVVVVRDAAGNTGRSSPRPFRVHRAGPTMVISRGPSTARRVGLTIDDCTDRTAWTSMLDTLDRLDAGATFFCNGVYVRRYPDVARRAANADRVSIGSHSTDHADLTTVGYGGTLVRLLGDESAWWDVARTSPAPWFRPPYGSYDSSVLAAAGDASFPYTVLWSIDTRDWDSPDAGTITSHAVAKAKPGSIILIHVRALTAQALPAIISGLRARGLEPVGLPELFRR